MEAIESRQIKVSVVSFWELVLKHTRKDAPVRDPIEWWDRYITRSLVETVPIRVQHVVQLNTLPDLHRDPFDRMLIAQASFEGLEIVTADESIARYVKTIWA